MNTPLQHILHTLQGRPPVAHRPCLTRCNHRYACMVTGDPWPTKAAVVYISAPERNARFIAATRPDVVQIRRPGRPERPLNVSLAPRKYLSKALPTDLPLPQSVRWLLVAERRQHLFDESVGILREVHRNFPPPSFRFPIGKHLCPRFSHRRPV